MKPRHTVLGVALLALAGMGLTPATQAAPLSIKAPLETAQFARGDVVHIGHKKHRRGGVRIGIHFSGGSVYFNGHRGYRHYKRGYKRHKGYYFPRRAFTIVIGPGGHRYVQRRHHNRHYKKRYRHVHLSRAHYRWCDARYRSYRYSDNSFQPYHGPRKPCVSPYY